MKMKLVMCLLAGLAILSGCGKREKADQASARGVPPVFVSEPLDGTPVPIPEARTRFKAGDEVVLSGLVMGVMHPFVEGRAVFVLGDEATITPCDRMATDHCPTPWDACCDPIELRSAGTATIQVTGEDGKPLRTGLDGVNGLTNLSRVTVSGIVSEHSTPEAFIVNAAAIHIGIR